jgi:hypothetical protein
LKICDFLPGTAILLKETVNLDNFPSVANWQIFKLGEARINKQHPGICQWRGPARKSYSWFFENPSYSAPGTIFSKVIDGGSP